MGPISVQPMVAMPPEVMAMLAPAVRAIEAETRAAVVSEWHDKLDRTGKVMIRRNSGESGYVNGVRNIMAIVFDGKAPASSTSDDDEDVEDDRTCECDACDDDRCQGECDSCEDYACGQCHGGCQHGWYSCCGYCPDHSVHHEAGGEHYCRHCERCSECEHACDND